ncbi:uncharacterized protein LOC130175761 [Seriola aureovittata]|uniref:uncharacterized protein LOC130175761 n=1 Tax=Seriola aureovittata TaxID=2871759 RepID=UPI0024BEB7A6|nr:uncharacterized protein LOC130175761 [Seriola aureovittata]
MEGRALQADSNCLLSLPKLPVWIIEYVWVHKMMDIQEVVDPSDWPDVDSQPLSIEDSWRLRVASAQVYSIVKNRDMEHFEKVMGFLEATYRLLPRLVTPIKHMKVMFGLKTMVIMWMLREGRGMVDTLFKIAQFFPSKLPQYQDQCNQHEMFLMRKNNMDFKALAQALAMDKDKLEDYIKKQMETQYGEHYAQKVEDRLLHYLHELETVLPGDTFIDKILKKESPVTEEEKLLLEVITSDSTTIATTLRKLLHCDVASCRPAGVSQSSEHGDNEMESSQLSKSVSYGSSTNVLLKSVEDKTPLEVFKGGEGAAHEVSKDSPLLWESDSHLDVSRHQQRKEDGEVIKRVEEEGSDKVRRESSQRSRECVREASSSPHFCSKHQRWVKSILQGCPDECSEELLLLQANVSSSPPLFQSSSSTSSSQDLTPSDLIPCPPAQQHPPSQTTTHAQIAAEVSKPANPKDGQRSGAASDNSQTEAPPLPSSRDTPLSALLSPVVRLIDIASAGHSCPTFKPHQASLNHFIMSNHTQTASASSSQVLTSPHCHTSRNKDSTFDQLESVAPTNPPNTMSKLQTGSVSHDAATFTSQTQTQQSFSRLSRKRRRACTTTGQSQTLDGFSQNPLAEPYEKAPTTSVFTANQITLSTISSPQVVPQNSIKPQTNNTSPCQSKMLPFSTVVSSTSSSDCLAVRSDTCRVRRAQLRLSALSQAVLLQSTLLQPYVSLTRLSAQECCRVTEGRSSARHVEPVLQGSNEERRKEEEEDSDSSFDVNNLYSSYSSSNDSEESLLNCDPEYKPGIKKKRLCIYVKTTI